MRVRMSVHMARLLQTIHPPFATHPSLHMSIQCTNLSILPYAYPSTYPSTHLSTCLHPPTCLSLDLSIYLPYQSVYSIYSSTYLSCQLPVYPLSLPVCIHLLPIYPHTCHPCTPIQCLPLSRSPIHPSTCPANGTICHPPNTHVLCASPARLSGCWRHNPEQGQGLCLRAVI
jgi:hypothetical protein